MIEWKNFDSLESYGELAKAERVKLAEVMSGESGAERRCMIWACTGLT